MDCSTLATATTTSTTMTTTEEKGPGRSVENPTGCGDGDIVSTRWEYGVVLHYFRVKMRGNASAKTTVLNTISWKSGL